MSIFNIMRHHKLTSVLIILVFGLVAANTPEQRKFQTKKLQENKYHRIMHYNCPSTTIFKDRGYTSNGDKGGHSDRWFTHEKDNSYWYSEAYKVLKTKIDSKLNTGIAKNIIFFLGDGMSIPTLMAVRVYLGQLNGKAGEEGALYWESFPYTGLSKTWCIDKQVGDSACTSTAYLGGVKSKMGTLGLNGNVERGNCDTQVKKNHVNSIAKWAQEHGKGTGIVTNARVTHASPAGTYAHSTERKWETDTDVEKAGYDPKLCHDIATQLVKHDPGKNFKVILGGGRRSFLPKTTIDEEGNQGHRSDGINLIDEWSLDKQDRASEYAYFWNRTSLNDVRTNPENYDYILGLFESSECQYNLEASKITEPTIAEMTEAAIKVLQKDKNGYFLFVEGSRIDDAHYFNCATLALDETVELAKAVKTAREITSEKDTLIIVTSDHSHTMSVAGYADRGNRINHIVGKMADDNIPYETLTYPMGPGYWKPNEDGSRYDPSTANYDDPRHQSLGLAPRRSSTHGGDDVAIFASGPWAHLFTGTMEQSNIPHFLGYASCINKANLSACTT